MQRVFYLRPGDMLNIINGMLFIDGKTENGFQVTEFRDEFDEDGNLIGVNTLRKSYSLDKKDLQRLLYDFTGHVYSFYWYTEDPDYIDKEV